MLIVWLIVIENESVTNAQITQTLNFGYANTWVTKGRIFFGPSLIKTPIAHYAITMRETHDPTYYRHVNIYI